MSNLGYIFVPIANAIIELGKIGAFTFLSYHFNNIWIMLFYIVCAGGGMSLSYHDKKEVDNNDKK